jgi:hypothetical protein
VGGQRRAQSRIAKHNSAVQAANKGFVCEVRPLRSCVRKWGAMFLTRHTLRDLFRAVAADCLTAHMMLSMVFIVPLLHHMPLNKHNTHSLHHKVSWSAALLSCAPCCVAC